MKLIVVVVCTAVLAVFLACLLPVVGASNPYANVKRTRKQHTKKRPSQQQRRQINTIVPGPAPPPPPSSSSPSTPPPTVVSEEEKARAFMRGGAVQGLSFATKEGTYTLVAKLSPAEVASADVGDVVCFQPLDTNLTQPFFSAARSTAYAQHVHTRVFYSHANVMTFSPASTNRYGSWDTW